jgi:hypothetical protein
MAARFAEGFFLRTVNRRLVRFSRHPRRDLRSWCLRAGALALSLPVGSSGGAWAQEALRPLEFEVRPSGVIAETPDEALDRRLKAREYLFRSICNHCSRGDRFSSNAPFKPYEALTAPVPVPEGNE